MIKSMIRDDIKYELTDNGLKIIDDNGQFLECNNDTVLKSIIKDKAILKEIERLKEGKVVNCGVCMSEFVRKGPAQKYCCQDCCKKAKARLKNENMEKEKHKITNDNIIKINAEAKKEGLSYGELQAKRYREQCFGEFRPSRA